MLALCREVPRGIDELHEEGMIIHFCFFSSLESGGTQGLGKGLVASFEVLSPGDMSHAHTRTQPHAPSLVACWTPL